MTTTVDRDLVGAEDLADAPDDVGAELPPPSPHQVPAALAPWHDPSRYQGWPAALAIVLIAAITRFWSLGFPDSKSFDEAYYATEAQELLRYGYEDNRGYMFVVHPPLGKWLIAGTSALWGNNSLGWRVAPALAGTIGVLMLARTARRMFRSNALGAIAGLLLALEGMSLVLARVALLDIFLQTFIIAGFAAMVLDRDQLRARLARLIADGADLSERVPRMGPRPWRLTAGVMFGLAGAVKWTALSFWILFALLALLWDRGAFKSAGVRQPWRTSIRRSWLGAFFSLGVAPIAAYLFCWLGWFAGNNSWNRHWADTHSASTHLNLPLGVHIPFWWGWVPGPIRSLGAYTLQAYRFHEGLDSGHEYASKPWSWLVLGRGVLFYYDGSSHACGAAQCTKTILLLGTPLMWWAFAPVLLWLLWHWATTRDWRAAVPWVAMLAGWFVWFQDLKRTMFLFYMAPLVPFLILGVTLGLGVMLGPSRSSEPVAAPQAAAAAPEPPAGPAPPGVLPMLRSFVLGPPGERRRRLGLLGVSTYLGLVVADFVWMWPIFSGSLITFHSWQAHMWFPSWV